MQLSNGLWSWGEFLLAPIQRKAFIFVYVKNIGSYQILKSIAKGGMAEVFLARSTVSHGLGKIVALKKTLPDYLDSHEMRQMFLDEMRIAACLNHQNIVQTFDFGMVNSEAYFVMEFIHGVSLRELIAYLRESEELLDLPLVFYIIKEIAEGLDYAVHVQDPSSGKPLNLIHRDLSPHNIMLTFDGEVKVIDFGIAKASASEHTTHGVVKGKVVYMSPEQIHGEPIDHRTDLFSLGIIFWELLTNRRFFSGSSIEEVRKKVMEYKIDNLNFAESNRIDFSKKILEKLLHHKPELRYQGARELIKDLNFILNRVYPQFSSQELSDHLKYRSFVRQYLSSFEELKAFRQEPSVKQSYPKSVSMLEKTLLTLKRVNPFSSPRLPPQKVLRMDQLRVVSENERIPLGKMFVGLVFVVIGCFGGVAFRVYFPNVSVPSYNLDLASYKDTLREFNDAFQERFFKKKKVVVAPARMVSITFSSVPSGATMLVDGQAHSLAVPVSLAMEQNKVYQVDIYKETYIPHSFKYVPKQETHHIVHLQSFPTLKITEYRENKIKKKVIHKKPKNR